MLKYKRNIQKIKNLYYAASYGDGYFLNGQITALGASGQTELLWDCLFLVFFFFFVFSEFSFFERLALRIFRCISIGRRGFQFKGDLLPISSVKSTIIEASKNNALKDSKETVLAPYRR